MSELDVLVRTLPTPNPNAIKFISNFPFKNEGKATFDAPDAGQGLRLVDDLFSVRGVRQIHMFENVVTVTVEDGSDMDHVKDSVTSVLKTRLPIHNPNFQLEADRKKDRTHLTPDLQKIEEILDDTIRPALQADGGDLEIVQYKDHVLEVLYQGACGTCPSSLYGTLEAIKGILQDNFDPEIDVVAVNQAFGE